MALLDRVRQLTAPVLSKEQRARFEQYYPKKIYRSERNIALVVGGTQVCMLAMGLLNGKDLQANPLNQYYLYLYVFLLLATGCLLPLYVKHAKAGRYAALKFIRIAYVIVLSIWLMGITALDHMQGNGLGVFCYLLPTLAAILLLPPVEGIIIYSIQWVILLIVLRMLHADCGSMFSSIINSFFVTVLAIFLSLRNYRNMAVEFRDRETIAAQYEEIHRANEKLNLMAHTDMLTGLYNRRYLIEHIFNQYIQCQAAGYYAELIMLDIDFFKQYNDSYGHLMGDRCLKEVTTIIENCIRKKDLAYAVRYGGEEFLVIHFIKDQIKQPDLAQCIQENVRRAHIPRNDIDRDHVTLSAGVWRGKLHAETGMESLISYADKALYRAKAGGRDCIQYES